MSLWGCSVHQGRLGEASSELIYASPTLLPTQSPRSAYIPKTMIRNKGAETLPISLCPMRFKPGKLVLQSACRLGSVESEQLEMGKKRKAVQNLARPVQGRLLSSSSVLPRRGIHPSTSGLLITIGSPRTPFALDHPSMYLLSWFNY